MRAMHKVQEEAKAINAETEVDPPRPEKNSVCVLVCIKCGEKIGTIPRNKIMRLNESPKNVCTKCTSLINR